MNLMHHIVKIIWLFSIITFGLGNTLSLQDNVDGTWNVNYESDSAIKSFEFVVDGSDVTSAGGGDAGAFEYTIEWSGAIVTGVWENIPYLTSGSGTLIVLELTGTPTGLSGIVILDPSGDNLNFTFDNIGCMDNGYQQWSPNWGSPACNYAQFAIIEGECLYNDCLGDCQEILDNDGNWIPNSYFTDTQFDGCGECGGDGSTCSDCNGVPNGTAYINPLCGIDNNDNGCVGGDTGIPDCLNIDLSFGGYMESNSTDTIKVFVTNLDTLKSLDIEFQYDSSIINITDFSLYGTALYNIGYEIAYDSFIEAGNFIKVNFKIRRS